MRNVDQAWLDDFRAKGGRVVADKPRIRKPSTHTPPVVLPPPKSRKGGTRKDNSGDLVKRLKAEGFDARHWTHGRKCNKCGQFVNANREKGWPDIDVFIGGGRVLFIEWKQGHIKRGGNFETGLNDNQKARFPQLRAQGYEILVTASIEEGVAWVKDRIGNLPSTA